MGLTAGHANAINQDDIDRFEKQTEEEYKNVIYDDGELQIKKEGNVYYLEQDNEVNSEKAEIKSDGNFIHYQFYKGNLLSKFTGKIPSNLLNSIKKGKPDKNIQFKLYDFRTKYINYDKNGEIESVTIAKNGKDIKTLCADGRTVKELYDFVDEDNNGLKNNCTGEISYIYK